MSCDALLPCVCCLVPVRPHHHILYLSLLSLAHRVSCHRRRDASGAVAGHSDTLSPSSLPPSPVARRHASYFSRRSAGRHVAMRVIIDLPAHAPHTTVTRARLLPRALIIEKSNLTSAGTVQSAVGRRTSFSFLLSLAHLCATSVKQGGREAGAAAS